MKEINRYLLTKSDFADFVNEEDQLLKDFLLDYDFSRDIRKNLIEYVNEFMSSFNDNLKIFVEFPYVDKLYRNSYYHYFSSKLTNISRDCMRLNFFKSVIEPDCFYSGDQKFLQNSYLGYLVLRPLYKRWIGRNLLSPAILKNSNIECCQINEEVSVNGIKLIASGFPHQSQDGEYCSCAETTIWSLIEYYSHAFPEFSSALIGDINSTSDFLKYDRNLPSNGFSLFEISQILKQFGFNTKVHSIKKDCELDDQQFFRKLMNIYIQSGIPLLCSIEFDNCSFGHAVLAIGTANTNEDIQSIYDEEDRDVDLMNLENKIVTINDNKPPYYIVDFNHPTYDYEKPMDDSSFCGFIAPLHKKVYLSAIEAQKISELLFDHNKKEKNEDLYSFLGLHDDYFLQNGPIFHNLFLVTSRNFKAYIFHSEEISPALKDSLISILLPKYIWVIELSNKLLYNEKLINGFILIDATSFITSNDLLDNMIICYAESLFYKSNEYNESKRVFKGQKPFKRYMRN